MLKYRHLHRSTIDEYFHQLFFSLYALLTTLIPWGTEIRASLSVVFESAMNLAKFFFRPPDEAHQIIEQLIEEFRVSYDEPGKPKVAIITGGTSGIGKAMAKAISKAGFDLYLPVRNMAKGEVVRKEIMEYSGNPNVNLMPCDLASLRSVRNFAQQFIQLGRPISLLINNAGVAITKAERTEDGLEVNMAVNFCAHYVLVESLMPILSKPPDSAYGCRIVNVTSASFYSVSELKESDFFGRHWYERFAPYARSKFANALHTMELAGRIPSSRVTVNCMEPGMVLTDIFRYNPTSRLIFQWFLPLVAPFIMLKAEEGAVTAIWLALSPDLHAVSGRVFADLREIPVGTAISSIRHVMPNYLAPLADNALSYAVKKS